MNISAYFGIIIAFAIGYVLGTITGRLLKFFVGIIVLASTAIGLYIYFLR